ncbi:MAG: translation initiation factor IF-3 [Vampirovibrionales bacterium]
MHLFSLPYFNAIRIPPINKPAFSSPSRPSSPQGSTPRPPHGGHSGGGHSGGGHASGGGYHAQSKGPQILNDRIRATEFRLIDGEGNRIVSRAEAEALAKEAGLDILVLNLEISPPVIKLVDYGKYKFEAEKKAKEAKKKQHQATVKELKVSVRIDDHDYQVKVQHAKKFLNGGDKVKLTLRLKGREMQHSNLAFSLVKQFVEDLEGYGIPDGGIRSENRVVYVVLSPDKQKPDKPDKKAEKLKPSLPAGVVLDDEAPTSDSTVS